MAKFSFAEAQEAVGIGSFVEKTIKFRGVNGETFEGEILIKVLSSEEVANITNILKLKKDEKFTLSQYRDAMLAQVVYESIDKLFFPDLKCTGQVSDEMKISMYTAADEVINFTGKHWISMMTLNSSVNSSAAELVEKQLQKPEEA